MKNLYTISLLGDGLLVDQSLTTNIKKVKETAFEYYEEYNEEYTDDGYIKILKYDEVDVEPQDCLVISLGDTFEIIREQLKSI